MQLAETSSDELTAIGCCCHGGDKKNPAVASGALQFLSGLLASPGSQASQRLPEALSRLMLSHSPSNWCCSCLG